MTSGPDAGTEAGIGRGAVIVPCPVLVGRAYIRCPVPKIRRSLAENLYEEETGGLVAGSPHPLLFLEYPSGLGMDLHRFEHVQLLPAAQRYRNFLDDATQHFGWDIAAAIVTIFVEGSCDERSALETEIARLQGENATLKKELLDRGLSVQGLASRNLYAGRPVRAVNSRQQSSAFRDEQLTSAVQALLC